MLDCEAGGLAVSWRLDASAGATPRAERYLLCCTSDDLLPLGPASELICVELLSLVASSDVVGGSAGSTAGFCD